MPRRRCTPRPRGRGARPTSPHAWYRSINRCAVARNRPGERSVSPRSEPVVAIATPHPSLGAPSTSPSGTKTSSKNTSAKPSSPSRRSTPRTVMPGDARSTRKYVRPRWRSASGSLRKRPKRCVQNAPRVVHVFWPDKPPAARGVVPHRLAPDPGQVAARVGLGPALAPRLFAGRHLPEDALLLLVGPELEDRRCEQEDAVLRDALRHAGAVVLLLEEEPLPQARVAAAVLLRPRHHGVARIEQRAFPLEMGREAGAGVARRERRTGDVRLEPRAALGAEPLLGGAEREVHRRADRTVAGIVRSLALLPAPGRRTMARWLPRSCSSRIRASPRSTSSARTRCSARPVATTS